METGHLRNEAKLNSVVKMPLLEDRVYPIAFSMESNLSYPVSESESLGDDGGDRNALASS